LYQLLQAKEVGNYIFYLRIWQTSGPK